MKNMTLTQYYAGIALKELIKIVDSKYFTPEEVAGKAAEVGRDLAQRVKND